MNSTLYPSLRGWLSPQKAKSIRLRRGEKDKNNTFDCEEDGLKFMTIEDISGVTEYQSAGFDRFTLKG